MAFEHVEDSDQPSSAQPEQDISFLHVVSEDSVQTGSGCKVQIIEFELCHEKTIFLHTRKQRRRSASR